MSKIIEITISPDGKQTQIHTQGFTGDACLKDTEAFEQALGSTEEKIMTPEAVDKDENPRLNLLRN